MTVNETEFLGHLSCTFF